MVMDEIVIDRDNGIGITLSIPIEESAAVAPQSSSRSLSARAR